MLMVPMKKLFRLTFSFLLFIHFSCVKDIDVDQYEEIVFPPSAALDLVYFTLDETRFQNGVTKAGDEVRLEFLDDDYMQDGLVRADLNFIYTNSFPQDFITHINFLSENNSVMYRFSIPVPAGSINNPETVNYIEIISGPEVDQFKRAIKMKVEIEMQPNSEAIEGELQLKSKGVFNFEF